LDALRYAAERTLLAPSIHNSQPWRLVLRRTSLELFADPARRLAVLDPRGRQLAISCGCALFNARVGLAKAGFDADVQRLPDAASADLMARLQLGASLRWSPLMDLDSEIEQRRSNRRPFLDVDVPPRVLHEVSTAAAEESAALAPLTTADELAVVAESSALAAEVEQNDPAYLAELNYWTADDPGRSDGVPRSAFRVNPAPRQAPASSASSTFAASDGCRRRLNCSTRDASWWSARRRTGPSTGSAPAKRSNGCGSS
jgi:nitroreductase